MARQSLAKYAGIKTVTQVPMDQLTQPRKSGRSPFPRLLTFIIPVFIFTFVQAQDIGTPEPNTMNKLYTGETYSPYAQRSFPSQVFWGEMHLHTSVSLDAGLFGNTLDHEDAYRFARGEEVISSTGLPVKLSRPLDSDGKAAARL